MKVFVGADYRGFEAKQELLKFLASSTLEVEDVGACTYTEGDDFNDPAIRVAKSICENRGSFGVLICDSAHGVTIQANRFKGIRAAHCENPESARLAREHDDANVLCLSAHFLTTKDMNDITTTFLTTNFVPLERRLRRINRLDEEI